MAAEDGFDVHGFVFLDFETVWLDTVSEETALESVIRFYLWRPRNRLRGSCTIRLCLHEDCKCHKRHSKAPFKDVMALVGLYFPELGIGCIDEIKGESTDDSLDYGLLSARLTG